MPLVPRSQFEKRRRRSTLPTCLVLAPARGRFTRLLESLVEYVGLQARVCEDGPGAIALAEQGQTAAVIVAEVDVQADTPPLDVDSAIVRLMLLRVPVCHVWRDGDGTKRMQSHLRGESSLVMPLALPTLRTWLSTVAEGEKVAVSC